MVDLYKVIFTWLLVWGLAGVNYNGFGYYRSVDFNEAKHTWPGYMFNSSCSQSVNYKSVCSNHVRRTVHPKHTIPHLVLRALGHYY